MYSNLSISFFLFFFSFISLFNLIIIVYNGYPPRLAFSYLRVTIGHMQCKNVNKVEVEVEVEVG